MRKVILTIFIICLNISINAQLTPLDVAKMQNVISIEISDDGKFVAYTVLVPADPLAENVSASIKLYLLNTETEKTVPFVTQGAIRSVKFRPNHSSITFLSKRDDKNTCLYEISLKGGEAYKLFSHTNSINAYDWSSDGNTLVFLARDSEKNRTSEFEYQPVIYEENKSETKAFVVVPGKSEAKQLKIEGNLSSVKFCPGDDKLACYVAPTTFVDDHYMSRTLTIADAKTGDILAKVDHKGKKGSLSWSPDGKSLAFIAGADINDPTDGRLFVVSDQGGKPKELFKGFIGKIEAISWDDKNTIRFLASEGVWASYGTVKKDGSGKKMIIKAGEFSISDFSVSKGISAFLVSNPKHASELYLMKKSDEKPRRITNVNPWLDEKKLANQEVISYEAKDGLKLDGILIRPLNEKSGTKYPLIVVVHGGPESHYDNAWLTRYSGPGQVAAAKGYAVFYPNYRGSTGRGVEFARTSQADAAGKEFDDIVDGVDYLIKTGLVDKDKVGVTGGSYGGYATAWMATRYTDRFAAGVMFVGISNKISKWGTTDIPKEEYYVHALKWIWEDYEFYLKRSPVYYAGKAKTPLLIMHGKEDTRVHPGQSMELYRHIKERTETPVRLVLYPGEGHGNRKSTARLDFNLRMMRWFDKFLLGKDIDLDKAIKLEY